MSHFMTVMTVFGIIGFWVIVMVYVFMLQCLLLMIMKQDTHF